jgi:hypothetical protein
MISVTLLGCDGSVWDLGTGSSGAYLSNGLGGLHLPPVSHLYTKTARGSGSTWRGARTESRAFSMNVVVGDPLPPMRTGPDWLTLDEQFWRALSATETSRLVVNGLRTLTFRLDESNADQSFDDDPSVFGIAKYSIDCIADRPEWTGAPTTATFPYQGTATTNFFGGGSGTKGPPFYISAANLLNTASISNPGDLPAYPVWTIQGPLSTATVGVGRATITLPFPLQSTDVVVIDAQAQTITDGQGNSLWPFMGYQEVSFAPVPPGDLVPVAAGMSGGAAGASISLTLTPLYRRAL